MSEAVQHTVATDAPRLDQYLAGLLIGESRSRVQRLITQGLVRLNDRPARPGSRLRAGDRLSWELPAPTPSRLEAEPMDLRIVYEDDDLAVVDKPAGLVVHPGPGHPTGTLVHGLLGRGPGWSTIGGTERPGIVHRLDRDTSGLLVVARSPHAHKLLQAALARREITREYLALVRGRPSARSGTIEAPVGRDPRARTRMSIGGAGARMARTHFTLERAFASSSLLRLRLETGRTHQIRVHLGAIGHPVYGDPEYGVAGVLGLQRQFLHACRLAFDHPLTGARVDVSSPLPADLRAALEQAERLS